MENFENSTMLIPKNLGRYRKRIKLLLAISAGSLLLFIIIARFSPFRGQLLNSLYPKPQSKAIAGTINVDPTQTFQTIDGWDTADQSGYLLEDGAANGISKVNPQFATYKDYLVDQAVNNLGIDRLRVEFNSGLENPVDFYSQYKNGQIDWTTYKTKRYEIINDDNDPNHINPLGFQFAKVDDTIDNIALPMGQLLAQRGERLSVILSYVDFGSSAFEHKNNPQEWGEFLLAAFQHMQQKYGFVPDTVEILEPINGQWGDIEIGNAVVAAGNILKAHGFDPEFAMPSQPAVDTSSGSFTGVMSVSGTSVFVKQLTYHRYGGVTDANIQAIAARGQQYGVKTGMNEHIGSGSLDLLEDLTLANVSSWQQYVLAFPTVDDGAQYFLLDSSKTTPDQIVTMSKKAYMLRQYFKYIRPGAKRIKVTSANTNYDPVAFINQNGGYVTVVRANVSGPFTVSGLPDATYGITYCTSVTDADSSDSAHCAALPDQSITAGQQLNTSIPSSGILTVYFKGPAAATPPPPAVTTAPTPAPLPGDLDRNGAVDIFDYNTLLGEFGKTGTGLTSDIDKNGKVDIFDYNILVTNFGKRG